MKKNSPRNSTAQALGARIVNALRRVCDEDAWIIPKQLNGHRLDWEIFRLQQDASTALGQQEYGIDHSYVFALCGLVESNATGISKWSDNLQKARDAEEECYVASDEEEGVFTYDPDQLAKCENQITNCAKELENLHSMQNALHEQIGKWVQQEYFSKCGKKLRLLAKSIDCGEPVETVPTTIPYGKRGPRLLDAVRIIVMFKLLNRARESEEQFTNDDIKGLARKYSYPISEDTANKWKKSVGPAGQHYHKKGKPGPKTVGKKGA